MNKIWIGVLSAAGLCGLAALLERRAHAYGEDTLPPVDQADPRTDADHLQEVVNDLVAATGLTFEQMRALLPPPPPPATKLNGLRGLGITKPAEGDWYWPLAKIGDLEPDVNSPYGDERTNAVYKGQNGKACRSAGVDSDGNADATCKNYVHQGVDLDYTSRSEAAKYQPPFRSSNARSYAFMPPDTKVLAVAGGKVVYADWAPKRSFAPFTSSGLYVAIDHNNRVVTQYLHLKQMFVTVGDMVTQGQVIGLASNDVGQPDTQGKFDSPAGGIVHLHFQVALRGKIVNPMLLLGQAKLYDGPADAATPTVKAFVARPVAGKKTLAGLGGVEVIDM